MTLSYCHSDSLLSHAARLFLDNTADGTLLVKQKQAVVVQAMQPGLWSRDGLSVHRLISYGILRI